MGNKEGTKWMKSDEDKLKSLVARKVSTEDIAKTLGRTEAAIRSKASELMVSLKPKDKVKK